MKILQLSIIFFLSFSILFADEVFDTKVTNLVENKKFDEALSYLDSFIVENPKSAGAYLTKGNVLIKRFYETQTSVASVISNVDEHIFSTSLAYMGHPEPVFPNDLVNEVVDNWRKSLAFR